MNRVSGVDGFQFVNDRRRDFRLLKEQCSEVPIIVSGHFALQTTDAKQAEICRNLKDGAPLSIHHETEPIIPSSMEEIASKHGIDIESLRQKTGFIRLKDEDGNILDILEHEASSAVVDFFEAGMPVEARVSSSEDMFDGWRIIHYRISLKG